MFGEDCLHKVPKKGVSCAEKNHHDCLHRHETKVIIVAFFSLFWLIFRSGVKPSRITYPCQQAALANVLVVLPFISATFGTIGISKHQWITKSWKVILLIFLIIVSGSVILASQYPSASIPQDNEQKINLSISSKLATSSPASNVYAVHGRETATISNLINLMSSKGLDFYALIDSEDVVLIKINNEWDQRGGTDTDVLEQLIQAIINHPNGFTGEIVVADNGQFQGSFSWENSNANYHNKTAQSVVDEFATDNKVSTFDWMTIRGNQVSEYSDGNMNDGYILNSEADPETGIFVSYPKFQTKYGTYISFKQGIWNGEEFDSNLKVINLPVLKSHNMYGVTGAVKHYMGVQSEGVNAPGGLANGHRSIANGGMGTLMAQTRMPTINILCAIWVNAIPANYEGAGPSTSYEQATKVDVLAASTDPVALDFWASKYILVPTAQAIGYSDTHTLSPESTDRNGVTAEAFGIWLHKAKDALISNGFQVISEDSAINVYVSSGKS